MKASDTWVGGGAKDLDDAMAFQWPFDLSTPITNADDKIVVLGGWNSNEPYDPVTGSPAENEVWLIQNPTNAAKAFAQPSGWGTMNYERRFGNAVLLPNLTLFVVGGSRNQFKPYAPCCKNPIGPGCNPRLSCIDGTTGQDCNVAEPQVPADPVYQPELLDLLAPAAGWTTLPPHLSPRLYHSIGLLLADGRVLCAGGYRHFADDPTKCCDGCGVQYPGHPFSDAEIFSPPYLTSGQPRPTVTAGVPSNLPYGGAAVLLDVAIPGNASPADEIEFVTLMRCGAVTHHTDWEQRCLKLPVTKIDANTISITGLPAASPAGKGDYVAPPGYYLLHVVTRLPVPMQPNATRVPSEGIFVHVP